MSQKVTLNPYTGQYGYERYLYCQGNRVRKRERERERERSKREYTCNTHKLLLVQFLQLF